MTGGSKNPGDEVPPGTEQSGEDICPECHGKGTLSGRTCPACSGTGLVTVLVGDA